MNRLRNSTYIPWNASTNFPFLESGKGVLGKIYIVNVPGDTEIDGHSVWQKDDLVIFDGIRWTYVSFIENVRSSFLIHAKTKGWGVGDLILVTDINHERYYQFKKLHIQEYWEYYLAGILAMK